MAAIILAAGLSSRMGAFKPLLPLGGRVLLRHMVDALRSVPEIDPLVVVTGHEAGKLRAAVADAALTFAHNPDYAAGEMLSSIQTGLRHLPGDTGAVLLALGDQPGIPPETIRRLVEAWQSSRAPLVIPVHKGRRGHPFVLSLALREEVLTLPCTETLKTVVNRHQGEALYVTVDDPAILADMDTPADYERAKKTWTQTNGSASVEK